MATVIIGRGVRTAADRPNLPATIPSELGQALGHHEKALLVAPGIGNFQFPLAPIETDATGFAPKFGSLSRDGRIPLITLQEVPLRTLSFSVTLKGKDRQTNIEEAIIDPLVKLTSNLSAVFYIWFMGYTERNAWRCTDLKISPTARTHAPWSYISRAKADFTFIEHSSVTANPIGPLTAFKAA